MDGIEGCFQNTEAIGCSNYLTLTAYSDEEVLERARRTEHMATLLNHTKRANLTPILRWPFIKTC